MSSRKVDGIRSWSEKAASGIGIGVRRHARFWSLLENWDQIRTTLVESDARHEPHCRM